MPFEVSFALCKKCGHEWIKRIPNPVQCPKCKRTDWNRDPARGQVEMFRERAPKRKTKKRGKRRKS